VTGSMDKHIHALGILYILYTVFVVVTGLLIFLLMFGTGALSGDPSVGAVLTTIGVIIAVVLILPAIPALIVGIGLLKYQEWARILGLILGAIFLLNFPFGTALGIYSIWALIQPDTVRRFAGR
jgi:hypothetical protein